MNLTYPGVYIEEVTGAGVIAGVGTNTAAFIGPAARGPFLTPTVITKFDEFQRLFGRVSDGWPYLTYLGRRFYLGHAVQGFFENGGARAVIVRVGSAKIAAFSVVNQASTPVPLFRLEARAEGVAANGYQIAIVAPPAVGTATPRLLATTATVSASDAANRQLTVAYAGGAAPLIAGDTIEILVGNTVAGRNRVTRVSASGAGPVLTLENPLPTGTITSVRMAFIDAQQRRVRLTAPSPALQAGSLVRVDSTTAMLAVVESTDADGFVDLRMPFQLANGTAPTAAVDPSGRALQPLDFGLRITDAAGKVLDDVTGLSLDPFHSGYVFRRIFNGVRVVAPTSPPTTNILAAWQPAAGAPAQVEQGVDDNPAGVALQDYRAALTALEDVDDVNIICAPDAANDVTTQQAVRDHCIRMRDRIAVLDVPANLPPANTPSALTHRQQVEARGGYAALYYPWLIVPEPVEPGQPRPPLPLPLAIPPSGHVAGVYARTDETLGVHEAPANTEIMGVMGLERVLSDREQGLINLKGVNALRIFPGEGRVIVWGARTTAPEVETDWTYVNVRRLMLYIEESLQEGLRWAVFKPNAPPLWKSLKRTIESFLERVRTAGGLKGERAQAYQVRIDEGLNPPDEIALGRLHIEIKVAPVRPAEFIIVRIGLWDGGAQVTES